MKFYFQPSALERATLQMSVKQVFQDLEAAVRRLPQVKKWIVVLETNIEDPVILDKAEETPEQYLTFHCPSCDSTRLECCEDGPYASEVDSIHISGDFGYGEMTANGDVTRYQCLSCGFILKDKDGNNIIDNEEVVEWIREHPEGAKL